jgi:hypothetical protein
MGCVLVVPGTLKMDIFLSDSSGSESARDICNRLSIHKPKNASEENAFRTVKTFGLGVATYCGLQRL